MGNSKRAHEPTASFKEGEDALKPEGLAASMEIGAIDKQCDFVYFFAAIQK